jgi:hypothetical protein
LEWSKGLSLQFSRSLRSLRVDSFRAARIGMILAALNMLALVLWFFLAKVTLYETSDQLSLGKDGRVNVEFSSEAMGRIRIGQSAILHINSSSDQPEQNLPAMVVNAERGGNQVQLLIMVPGLSSQIQGDKISGQAQVEVEYVTPAELVLRTSGKYLGGGQVPASPQHFGGQEGQ